jgi:transcriptional regulator NrdR family protein
LCGGKTAVIDSRPAEDEITRRRECKAPDCGHRFTTIEIDLDLYERITPPDYDMIRSKVDRSLEEARRLIYAALK